MTALNRRREAVSPRALALLLWVFAFMAFAGTTLLASHPLARAGGVLLFAGPPILWVVLRGRWRPDRLDVAILVGMGAHVVVSLMSLDRTAGLEMSGGVGGLASAYWLARAFGRQPRLRRATNTAIVMALLFWLVVLAITWVLEKVFAVQALGWPPPSDVHQPWVWGSVNTPPVLALLVAPFLAWSPPGVGRRALVVVWLLASVVVVPLSLGRSAWLGIAVAAGATEILLGFPTLRRVGISLKVARRLIFGGVLGVVALGVTLGLAGRLDWVAVQLDSRVRLWDQALRLFASDPLTGAGPSTFGWARLTHVADYVDRVAAKDVHSVPLQTLSDGGLVLGAAAVLIVVAWTSLLIERWASVDTRQRIAVAALLGYATFALLDDLSFLPSITVVLIVLAAWALPHGAESGRTGAAPPMIVAGAVLLATLITMPSVIAMTTARVATASGQEAAVRLEWTRASAAFQAAITAHPENAHLWMSLGLALAREGRTADAVGAYERARELNRGDPRPWGALAALTADGDERASLLDGAVRRSNDPRYSYRLAELEMSRGNTDAAARSYAHAVALWPDWWEAVPSGIASEVRPMLSAAIEAVGPIGGLDLREAVWNAALESGELPPDAAEPWQATAAAHRGDFSRARDLLARSHPSARTDLAAAAVARMACDQAAFKSAQRRLSVRPPNLQAGDHPVAVGRPGIYRDPELGDYQPIIGQSVPQTRPWPMALVEVPPCDW